MHRFLTWSLLISAFLLFGVLAPVWAQPQQSENFRITKSVLDAGGGPGSSETFRLVSAFGQPTPIGISSSESFSLSAGFLSPAFGTSPLSDIQNLVILRVGTSADMRLNWERIPAATSYTVHRDTNPLFVPGPANQIGTAIDTIYTDAGAVNLAPLKYYYNVKAYRGNAPLVASAPNLITPEFRAEPMPAAPLLPVIQPADIQTEHGRKE